jgi:hypothetical protein
VRRLARYILDAFTMLSLLLCAGTVFLWTWGYVAEDSIERSRHWTAQTGIRASYHRSYMSLVSTRGRLMVMIRHDYDYIYYVGDSHVNWQWAEDLPGPLPFHPETAWERIGFILTHEHSGTKQDPYFDDVRIFGIPFWLPTLLFGIPPLLMLRGMRRSTHRRALGLCPVCGYDLRATPNRCPECGTVPTPNTQIVN